MACNGYNHHPSCNCGWGGVWYGGSSSNDGWLFNKPWTTRKLGRQPSTFDLLAANYTKPNVSCPVCGETVFYFRSRYGGRVYFDSLGPPWPKHPCTSSDGIPRRVSIIPWQEDEWRALSKVHIELISENKRTYSIRGESNGNINVFYCCSPVVITADIVRVKRVGYGVFSASMLYFEPTEQTWYVVDIPVFTSEKDAIEHGPGVSIESVALQQEECPFYLSTRYKQNSEKEKKNNVVSLVNETRSEDSIVTLKFQETNGRYLIVKSIKFKIYNYDFSISNFENNNSLFSRRELLQCPYCHAKLNKKNIRRHIRIQHGYLLPI